MVEVGLAEGPWSLTDHGRRAETKLRSNLYDLEAWSVLVREAQVNRSISWIKVDLSLLFLFHLCSLVLWCVPVCCMNVW